MPYEATYVSLHLSADKVRETDGMSGRYVRHCDNLLLLVTETKLLIAF